MKRYSLYVSMLLLIISMGCRSTTVITSGTSGPQHIPPGQMKKMTGSKSAKQYAPGQQKQKKNKH